MVIVNGATNVIFDRDVFAYSASRGLTIYGANNVVTNSWVVDNGYAGLHGNKSDAVDVEYNFVAGNNAEHFLGLLRASGTCVPRAAASETASSSGALVAPTIADAPATP